MMLSSVARGLARSSKSAAFARALSGQTKVTASMVKELRERTGSPMMECKKALSAEEVNGDMGLATEWLRKQGVAMAAKKMDRAMNDGLIGTLVDDARRRGVVVEVSAETDFVARNALFQSLVSDVARVALAAPTVEPTALLSAVLPAGETVQEALVRSTATVGENIGLKNATAVAVEKGAVGSYIHNKRSEVAGTQGALVALECEDVLEGEAAAKLQAFADTLAMHVVGAQARFLDGVPEAVLEKERQIEMERLLNEAREKAQESGKEPDEEVLKKRAGKKMEKIIKKMTEEDVLLQQQLISKDTSQSGKVSKVLATVGKELGTKLHVSSGVRFQVGAEEQVLMTPLAEGK